MSPGRRRVAVLALAGGFAALVAQRLANSPSQAGSTARAGADTGTPAMAASGDGMNGAAMAGGAMAPTVLASVSQIPVGGAMIFAAHKVVVTRPTAQTVKAFRAVCTHAGCVVNKVRHGKIYCPCHGGVFNLDGTVASGPPPQPLPAAPQVQVHNGMIVMMM